MVTLKHLIAETDYCKVWECLKRHYKDMKESSIENFKMLYERFATLTPAENKKNMFIYINVFKDDGNDDYICPESFDENDTELYFDVCGKDNEWCGYSLVANSFEEWLGFYVDDKTLVKLSYQSIIAHCLWEMTFFGFEQKLDEEGNLIVD